MVLLVVVVEQNNFFFLFPIMVNIVTKIVIGFGGNHEDIHMGRNANFLFY